MKRVYNQKVGLIILIHKTLVAAAALSGALLLGATNNKVEAAVNTPSTYTVKAGDTLWGISHKYGVSLNRIEELNNKSSLIYVGDKIKLTGAHTYTAPVVQTKVNYNASTQASNQAASQSSAQSSHNQSVTTQQSTASTSTYSNASTSAEGAAKEQIAQAESGGSYTAVNPSTGAYGKYQLLPQYLHGDYSPANQERVADQYVAQRYNGWIGALAFRQAHGWY